MNRLLTFKVPSFVSAVLVLLAAAWLGHVLLQSGFVPTPGGTPAVAPTSGPALQVMAMAVDPTVPRVAVAGRGGHVRLLALPTGSELARLPDEPGDVRSVLFTADGTRLALGGRRVTLREVATGKEAVGLPQSDHWTLALAVSSDGQRLAAAGEGTRVWDLTAGSLVSSAKLESAWSVMAVSPDADLVAAHDARAANFGVVLFDLAGAKELERLPVGGWECEEVELSPDGQWLAAAAFQTIVLFRTANRSVPVKLEGHRDRVRCLAFSRDGSRLASASYDGELRVWDVAGRKLVRSVPVGTASPVAIAFTADASQVVGVEQDARLHVW